MQVKTYEKIQRAIELSVAARENTPLTQKGRQIIANIYTRQQSNSYGKYTLTTPGIGELVERLSSWRENHKSHLGIAEHRELVSFLEQPVPALRKRNLPARSVLDSFHQGFSPHHSPPLSFLPSKRVTHIISGISDLGYRTITQQKSRIAKIETQQRLLITELSLEPQKLRIKIQQQTKSTNC